jgi:hypothetical protein
MPLETTTHPTPPDSAAFQVTVNEGVLLYSEPPPSLLRLRVRTSRNSSFKLIMIAHGCCPQCTLPGRGGASGDDDEAVTLVTVLLKPESRSRLPHWQEPRRRTVTKPERQAEPPSQSESKRRPRAAGVSRRISMYWPVPSRLSESRRILLAGEALKANFL